MALHYQLVFALLIVEIVYVTLLITPVRRVRRLLVWFGKSQLFQHLLYLNKITMCFVFILCLDAGYRMLKASKEDRRSERMDMDALLHSKLFYAQRNFYMTGFTLLLDFVIMRMQHMVTKLERFAVHRQALEKQGKGASDEYMRLQEENTALKKEIKEYGQLKEEVEKKEKQAEALIKQNKGLEAEYDRLLEEYNQLKKEESNKKDD